MAPAGLGLGPGVVGQQGRHVGGEAENAEAVEQGNIELVAVGQGHQGEVHTQQGEQGRAEHLGPLKGEARHEVQPQQGRDDGEELVDIVLTHRVPCPYLVGGDEPDAAHVGRRQQGEAELARLLGEYIGICFQIKDDIFDYFDNKEIGKPTGNDMLEGKLTLPALYVLNTTKNEEAQEIAIKVKEGTATLDEIAHLISFIKENGGIEYAVQTMNVYKQKAFNLLASLPDSDICAALRAYLDYVVDREK